MSRPLMQHSVQQLEESFARAKTNSLVLKQLEGELRYRQVPRAVALLAEVQAVMYGNTLPAVSEAAVRSAVKPAMPASEQSKLFEHPEAPTAGVMRSPVALQTPQPPMRPLPPKLHTSTAVAIPLDEAYKLLKTSPGSTWESIEQTRRMLVQQAHPSRVSALSALKRAQVETEAARVNAAYLKLSALRCHN